MKSYVSVRPVSPEVMPFQAGDYFAVVCEEESVSTERAGASIEGSVCRTRQPAERCIVNTSARLRAELHTIDRYRCTACKESGVNSGI